mmetsp:Transcript_139427/g.246001  ORF Transcript_139427/g.246001 Transcript_139427/m.246001 type:complete len:534 (+) Transcript_139427:67-1668(+)
MLAVLALLCQVFSWSVESVSGFRIQVVQVAHRDVRSVALQFRAPRTTRAASGSTSMQMPGLTDLLSAFQQKLKPPPAPPSLPVVGNLPLIGMEKAAGLGPPPHVLMSQLAEVYGDVMELQMGRDRWVVLSSPSAVHEAFVVKANDFSGRPMVPSMSISSGGGQGFAQPQLTPELKNLRRTAFSSLFDAAQVRRAQAELEEEAALLAEHLAAVTAASGGVEIRPVLRRGVTNFVLRYAFSSRVPYATETAVPSSPLFRELVEVADQIWSELTSTQTTMADLIAPPSVAGAPSFELQKLVRRRDALLRRLVSLRRQDRASANSSDPRDMLDALLDASLTDSEVHYTLVDLFVAGVNTVSTQLEWFLLLTAKEPQVQVRARADVKAGGDSRYTRALIKEVLRAKPPLLLPRQAVVDSSIGGYAVPAGRVVLANNWALTHGEDWWHKPSAFRPERWLEEERSLEGADACKFIPYSTGRRMCPGSRLADAELAAATHVLLRSVRWMSSKSPIDLREEYSLTLAPKLSQSLRFERLDRH